MFTYIHQNTFGRIFASILLASAIFFAGPAGFGTFAFADNLYDFDLGTGTDYYQDDWGLEYSYPDDTSYSFDLGTGTDYYQDDWYAEPEYAFDLGTGTDYYQDDWYAEPEYAFDLGTGTDYYGDDWYAEPEYAFDLGTGTDYYGDDWYAEPEGFSQLTTGPRTYENPESFTRLTTGPRVYDRPQHVTPLQRVAQVARQQSVSSVNRVSDVRRSNITNVRNIQTQAPAPRPRPQPRPVPVPVPQPRPVPVPVPQPQPVPIVIPVAQPQPIVQQPIVQQPVIVPVQRPVAPNPVSCTLTLRNTGFNYSVLTWTTYGATSAHINNAVGNVPVGTGSRNVPAITAVPYTMTVIGTHGQRATCASAQTQVAAPTVTVAANTTPAYRTVAVSSVPYTGPDDVAYVLTLLATTLGAAALIFANRRRFAAGFGFAAPAFASIAQRDEEVTILREEIIEPEEAAAEAAPTFEEVPESNVSVDSLTLEQGENGPKLNFCRR